MKKKLFHISMVLAAGLLLTQTVLAQGIGVNTTGANPDPSAILDASSTSQGFLPPRMTTAERDAIQNPALGLMVFNTTSNCVEVFYGTFWQSMHCGCSVAPSDLTYSDNGPITYCLNQSIPLNSPATQGGNPSSYTVLPPLPAGLFLNTTTGQLSGSPAAETAASDYTFSASNACGSTTREISIEVITIPSTPQSIGGPSTPTVNFTATYSIAAVSEATSYTWTVPSGWMITSGQGTTLISVTAGTIEGDISVMASNSCGTSPASIRAVSVWRPVTATGGTISDFTANGTNGINGGQYRVHSFITVGSSNFNVTDVGTDGQVDFLIVAGGGGGGSHFAGGGGAGGLISGSTTINSSNYQIIVGGGGNGNSYVSATSDNSGANGANSSFASIGTAVGGGGGGGRSSALCPGKNGGSGGGGGNDNNSNVNPGAGTSGQGFDGGFAFNSGPSSAGGGGGGAGGAGGNASFEAGGARGSGIQHSINGISTLYAQGGGGAPWTSNGLAGGSTTINAAPNSGCGGGGGASSTNGGSGGSGIVIVRYPLTNPNL